MEKKGPWLTDAPKLARLLVRWELVTNSITSGLVVFQNSRIRIPSVRVRSALLPSSPKSRHTKRNVWKADPYPGGWVLSLARRRLETARGCEKRRREGRRNQTIEPPKRRMDVLTTPTSASRQSTTYISQNGQDSL